MIGTYFRLMKYGENENGSQQCAYNGEFFFPCSLSEHIPWESGKSSERAARGLRPFVCEIGVVGWNMICQPQGNTDALVLHRDWEVMLSLSPSSRTSADASLSVYSFMVAGVNLESDRL